jgi:hypothetical protein
VVKFILCQGLGFSPGSVKYVPTLGFTSSSTPVVTQRHRRFLTLRVGR